MSHLSELQKLSDIFKILKKKGLLDDFIDKRGTEFYETYEFFYIDFSQISSPYSQFLNNLASHTIGINAGQTKVSSLLKSTDKLTSSLPNIFSAAETEASLEALQYGFDHYIEMLDSTKYALCRMYLISLVAAFEAYIHDVLLEIYLNYPYCMISDHKTLSYREALNFENIDELVLFLATVEADKATNGPIVEYLIRSGKSLGVDFSKLDFLIKQVDELVAIRNLMVHKGGFVDKKFMQNQSFTDLKGGDQIIIEPKNLGYISESFRVTVELVEAMLSKKFPNIAKVTWNDDLHLTRDYAAHFEVMELSHSSEFTIIRQEE